MNGVLNESTVVKEYDFIQPDIYEIDYLLEYIFKNCRNMYSQTFEYKFVYNIKFTNVSNNKEVNFTITHRSTEFKTEFYGWNKKIKNARRNGFIINQINKLTMKIYSIISNINIHFF